MEGMLIATETSSGTATSIPMLPWIPGTSTITIADMADDSEHETRWFSSDGCIVFDGIRRDVYVGRRLIGTFEADDVLGRNLLLVSLSTDTTQHRGRLAKAFGVSRETLRLVRRRYVRGGLAALVPKKHPGPEPKVTTRVERGLWRMFDKGREPRDVLEKAKERHGIGRSTVYAVHKSWKEKRATTKEAAVKGTEEARQVELEVEPTTGEIPDEAPEEAELAVGVEPTSEEKKSTSAKKLEGESEADDEVMAPLCTRTRAVKNASHVQHLGVWLLLAAVEQLGLFTALNGVVERSMAGRVRLAVEAVVAALGIGQRCVEGVRRVATPTATALLRGRRMPSAPWVRATLGKLVEAGGVLLHGIMAHLYVGVLRDHRHSEDAPAVFYVDNHMRPYTGKQVVRKGWRMQDKRARPGCSDYWVHDIDGRPVKRETAPEHGSLTDWLLSIGRWLRRGLGGRQDVLLAFDRAGAFPQQMAMLRDEGLHFVTYERRPFPLLSPSIFDRTFELGDESYRLHESRLTNLGKGRGRVRRIAVLTPDGRQVNLLAVSDLPAEVLVAIMRGRWCQENGFKHGNERWGFNQLDGRQVEKYSPDTVVPNPKRRRLDRAYRLACVREGDARRELARLEPDHPRREKLERELDDAMAAQEMLQASRMNEPKHAELRFTELADDLVFHKPEYKTLLDTIRIACINAEADLASDLAPLLSRPREAKKVLANLFAAPGSVRVNERTIRVTLAPAATDSERDALSQFLAGLDDLDLTLPGDTSGRRLTFRCPN